MDYFAAMLTNRLFRRTARFFSRGGFTLVELLVVIAIIAILAGVALGPITAGIKKAQQSGAVQGSHGLALAEFQYAGDNNNIYPYATTLGGFAALLIPTYVSDNAMFIVSGSSPTKYTGTTPCTGLVASGTASGGGTCSYDFTYASTTTPTGLTTSAPDNTPAVFTGAPAALAMAATRNHYCDNLDG